MMDAVSRGPLQYLASREETVRYWSSSSLMLLLMICSSASVGGRVARLSGEMVFEYRRGREVVPD
jgi:hypothetical protein